MTASNKLSLHISKNVQEAAKYPDTYSLPSPNTAQSTGISLAWRSIDAVHINVSNFLISDYKNFNAFF